MNEDMKLSDKAATVNNYNVKAPVENNNPNKAMNAVPNMSMSMTMGTISQASYKLNQPIPGAVNGPLQMSDFNSAMSDPLDNKLLSFLKNNPI